MTDTVWAATKAGVIRIARHEGDWAEAGRSLEGQDVTCISAQAGVLLAGTRAGIYRSQDRGRNWQNASRGMTHDHLRWMAFHPQTPGLVLAGTEPAGIYRSEDGGLAWHAASEIEAFQRAGGWFLPYSPESGCIRGFAWHGSRAYAAAEVGGALRSDDSGQSWRLTEGSQGKAEFQRPPEPYLHPDVHSVATHPSSADLVYAPTGDGFYRSTDGGKTWRLRYDAYCRAVWVDDSHPEHLILGPADDVDTDGRIEESKDGGATWALASEGLRVPWKNHMVERFLQVDRELLAILSNGRVLASALAPLSWRPILPGAPLVRALAWELGVPS